MRILWYNKQVVYVQEFMTDEGYMELALAQARLAFSAGEVPVGAVLVVGGRIVARSHNECEMRGDATAHAELLAISAACQKLSRWRLTDATLYVTLEPCPMCAGAIYNARLGRLVYGAVDSRAGGCESVFNIVSNPYLMHQTIVRAGVLELECQQILRDFFALRR